MYIGVGWVALRMPENASLKDKRQVVRSVLQRLRNDYQVAAAEVGSQDTWTFAELGISYVSNDARHAEEVLAKAVHAIETSRLDAELMDSTIEVLQH